MFRKVKKKIPEISSSGIQHPRKSIEDKEDEKCASAIVNKIVNLFNEEFSCLNAKLKVGRFHTEMKSPSNLIEGLLKMKPNSAFCLDVILEHSQSSKYAALIQVQRRHINV